MGDMVEHPTKSAQFGNKSESEETHLQPRINPSKSIATIPPTPKPMGKLMKGTKMIPTWDSGNAHAVTVNAAYIAPLAPRLGRIA